MTLTEEELTDVLAEEICRWHENPPGKDYGFPCGACRAEAQQITSRPRLGEYVASRERAAAEKALLDAADALDYEGNLYMEEILRIADGLRLTGSYTIESARHLIQHSRTEPAEWLRDRAGEIRNG